MCALIQAAAGARLARGACARAYVRTSERARMRRVRTGGRDPHVALAVGRAVVLDAAGCAVLVHQRAVRVRRARAAGAGAARGLGVARVLREDVLRQAQAAGDRVAAAAGAGAAVVLVLVHDLARVGARGARRAAQQLRVALVAGQQVAARRGRGGRQRRLLLGARALLARDGDVQVVCKGGGWGVRRVLKKSARRRGRGDAGRRRASSSSYLPFRAPACGKEGE